jgi:2-polyprenyl-3-methyl-5-hydroxy-6-metoxy-1,4-benzoquinol methylase
MPETITSCPICNNNQFQPYLDCIDYTVSKERFHLDECRNCHFIFTNPRPSATEIGKYYQSEDYISHTNSSKGIQNKLYKVARNYAIRGKLKLIDSLQLTNKNLLDYGCGTGEFLAAAANVGWQVQGMEPDPGARSRAVQNHGLKVSAPEDLKLLESESVNVITLWHVLEHVHELQATIQQFQRVLQPGGHLIIAVPNCDSADAKAYGAAWAAYDVPRHLYHFTLPVMQRLMEANALELQSVSGMFFDPFYISLLSEKYRGGINPIRAGWNGMITNLKGTTNVKNHSSLLYVFRKKN